MRHSSVLGFGGAAAHAVGILYVLVGCTHFLLPRAQLRGAGGVTAAFFQSLSESSMIFSLHYWIVAVLSLLMIAVYLALLSLLREHLSGPLCWAGAVGIIGAALSTVDFAYVGVEAPRLAEVFSGASPAAQSVLVVSGMPHIDPCFLASGLMGIFSLVANAVAMRHRLLPRALGYTGVVGGILLLLVFMGALFRSPRLIDVTVGLGGLLIGPVWYFWVGFVLRRAGRSARAVGNET
jgi:Domain of unknown function (DUF4386)